MVLLRNKDQR